MSTFSRRDLLQHAPAVGLGMTAWFGLPDLARADSPSAAADVPPTFPVQDPDLAREVVGLSHRDLDGVRALVEARPALAKATIDWGFGDWETALGAASHVGRPDIAELLLRHGARPDLFTFAMLGNVAAVRAIVDTNPELRRLRGPHGITLLQHARNGDAKEVVEYLESLGDADPRYRDEPIGDADRAALLGEYPFGPGPDDVLIVREAMGGVGILKRGGVVRRLFHQGDLAFHPAGAPAVQVRFEREGDVCRRVHIADAAIHVTGVRAAG